MGRVKGSKDGLVLHNNILGKKSEPLVTVEKLRNTWLFGVKIRDKETGEEFPDESYQNAIDTAISLLEHYLDVSIAPVRNFIEYKDYSLNDYENWGFFQLNNFPVEAITKLRLVYFRDEDAQPIVVQEIPTAWLRLQPHDGIVRMIPNTKYPANLQIGANGGFFPELLRAQNIPQAWEFTYDYGFCDGMIPSLLNQAISMVAAIICLITAGHLILGAGIAGTSISLDGLSQSIQTTQSAENSGFSSVIKDISDKLYGKTKDDPFAIMTILKNYYKGYAIHVL
jgi:hypothetical protein